MFVSPQFGSSAQPEPSATGVLGCERPTKYMHAFRVIYEEKTYCHAKVEMFARYCLEHETPGGGVKNTEEELGI